MLINDASITGSLIVNASASLQNISLGGNIIPDETNLRNLGSTEKFFKEIYVSTGSINFVDGGNIVAVLSAGTITAIQSNTSSANSRLDAIEIITSSTTARLSALETSSASVDTLNTNQNSRLGSLEMVSASNISRIASIETITSSNISRLSALEATSASVDTLNTNQNSRLSSLEIKTGSLATTGSNTFIGTQTITGSLFISANLVVQGTSSLQNITASAVSIGTNIVNLNTANPAIRFAGLVIGDSGSVGGSGSFLYDSVQDEMIFVHRGTSTVVTSSVTLMGPETYDNVGNETYLTANRITKGTGNEHLANSCIFDNGTTVCINANLVGSGTISGTNVVFSGEAVIGGSLKWGQISGGQVQYMYRGDNGIFANQGATSNSLYSGPDSFSVKNASDTSTLLTILNTGGAATFSSTIRSNATNGLAIGSIAGYRRLQYDNSTTTFGFLTDGNSNANITALGLTLTGALNGTSAVFSSDFLQNETSKVGISFAGGFGQINSWGANTSTYGGLKFQLSASNGNTLNALTLASTGAACFSSTVTAIGGYFYGQTINSFVRLDNSVGSQIGYLNYADITFDSEGHRFYTGTGTSGSRTQKLFLATSGAVSFSCSVTMGGDVGIGITTPFSRLHVRDSNTATGTIAIGHNEFPGLIFSSAQTGEFRIDNRSSFLGFITFYPNGQAASLGSEAMRITSNNNVLIGSAADNGSGAILQVAGGIDGNTFSSTGAALTVNANTQFKQGFYRWNENSTGLPEGGFFAVVIYGNGSNVTAQMATHFTNANTYVRSYNSAWTEWRRII